jgi:hypothetical protein
MTGKKAAVFTARPSARPVVENATCHNSNSLNPSFLKEGLQGVADADFRTPGSILLHQFCHHLADLSLL